MGIGRRITKLIGVMLAVLGALSSPARAQDSVPDPATMPLAELEEMMPNEHPAGYFFLAIRKFEAGEKDEAVRWLYIGQIRWRFHIAANPDLPPDGDSALLASMMEMVGRPINEWAGGDVDGWIGSMQAALDWDATNPNGFTSKEDHPSEYETVRGGLGELIASIEQQRDDIPAERARNGLETRVP